MVAAKKKHPPDVPLVVRIGVTGHRLDSLKSKSFQEAHLRAAIREALVRIRTQAAEIHFQNSSVYRETGPVFRIISPLAEGSDRFVAEEALAMGFQLQCPLPFPREEYKQVFETDASRESFEELISKARPVFELDGSLQARESAYELVGRVVLRQSDLLLAIWDGEGPRGRGGTGQVVMEALLRKVPVVWIHALPPHSIRLLEQVSDEGKAVAWHTLDDQVPADTKPNHERGLVAWLRKLLRRKQPGKGSPIGRLNAHLRDILALPSKKEIKALRRFLGERQRRIRLAIWYRLFCKIFVWTKWKIPKLRVEDFDTADVAKWLAPWEPLREPNRSVGRQLERRFRRPFIWADRISEIYADRYRSSFIIIYLLGAWAVLAAFLGSHPGLPSWLTPFHDPHVWFEIEFALIAAILLLVALNRWGGWHERWIDYRLLAEGLRQMRALAPFAYVTPAFEVPAHLSEDNQGPTWFNWYFRGLVREAGLVEAMIDKDYLDVCRGFMKTEVAGQVDYHRENEGKLEALHHRLHWLSVALFLLTLGACVLHIVGIGADWILTLFAIVFPAFGAAIQGIIHQGEFDRITRRSRSIKLRLESMAKPIEDPEPLGAFRDLGRVTESFCEIQLLEQADWRSVFLSKEVSLP